jgi:hypothetical protein
MDIVKEFETEGLLFLDLEGHKINGSYAWGVFCNTKKFSTNELDSSQLASLVPLLSTNGLNKTKKGFVITEGWDNAIDVHLIDILSKRDYEYSEAAGIAYSVRGDYTILNIESGKEIRVDK